LPSPIVTGAIVVMAAEAVFLTFVAISAGFGALAGFTNLYVVVILIIGLALIAVPVGMALLRRYRYAWGAFAVYQALLLTLLVTSGRTSY
jgi:hypothetical protein